MWETAPEYYFKDLELQSKPRDWEWSYIFLPATLPHSQLLVCIGGIFLKEGRKWTSGAGLIQSRGGFHLHHTLMIHHLSHLDWLLWQSWLVQRIKLNLFTLVITYVSFNCKKELLLLHAGVTITFRKKIMDSSQEACDSYLSYSKSSDYIIMTTPVLKSYYSTLKIGNTFPIFNRCIGPCYLMPCFQKVP